MTEQEEIVMFKQITENMAKVFAAKRHDYGASTTETWEKYGPVSMITRMHDKLNRSYNLLCKYETNAVADEKVQDTLLDLANYSVIAIIELAKAKERKGNKCDCDNEYIKL